MKEVNIIGKIKKYMVIYQVMLVALACVLTFIVTGKNVFITIICAVLTAIISIIISTLYNTSLRREFKKEKDRTKIKDSIGEELEYNTPIPSVVVDIYGKIIWYNNVSKILFNKKELLNKKLGELLIDFDMNEIVAADERISITNFKIGEKFYDIKYEIIRKQSRLTAEVENFYVIYFFDVTEREEAKLKYEHQRTLFGYIYIDNYEEIVNSTEDTKRPMMLGVIERKIQTFAKELGGSLRKIEKDRFILILSKESLDKITENKFKILEEVRKINVGNELPVTLSMGISLTGDSIEALMESSKDAAEIAISRGGNQAVVKKNENDYEYFGAKSKQEVEGSNASRAKARIKAYALKEFLQDVDNVIIMGHTNPDLDAIGSAMGMARVCRELGKETHIILNKPNNAVEGLYNKVMESDEFDEDYFITLADAERFSKEDTALIVVDVNVPSHTESPEIFEVLDKVAVIDHHIRGNQFIENAKVVYLDPFASSASEEVIQIAQYMVERIKFNELEIDAMLAGILVDTKNFMFKTGVKTFEAAAYLKKNGADNMRVKAFFLNDIDSFKKKAQAFRQAEVYKANSILTICPSNVKSSSTLVAQIADEMLNITGIEASFVVYDNGEDTCFVSARSNGNVNVQLIMENLGGGGHFTAAGVQIKGKKAGEIINDIKKCIDAYLDDLDR